MGNTLHVTIHRSIVFTLLAVALGSCGGDVETALNPSTVLPPPSTYNGPAPATTDVQSFRVNVWENMRPNNRCGSCHDVAGPGPVAFVRQDDVNLA